MQYPRAAWLKTLIHAEGTDQGTDPYRVCYGFSHVIGSLDTHPAMNPAENWHGIPITSGKYAGLMSTAAGAYQITKPTFLMLSAALHTHDFQPGTQDAMALELCRRAGALPAIDSGDLPTAFRLLAPTWASLPGSTAGQGGRSAEVLIAAYRSYTSVLAGTLNA